MMFLALRELRFARGRFALMGIVIALISVLVVLLSGLSSGLVNDGVSGLKSIPATAFAFNEGTMTDNAFSRSVVDDEQIAVWQEADGVAEAEPMGVNIVNGVTDQGTQIDLTLLGVEPDGFVSPKVSAGEGLGAIGGIVVSEPLRDEGIELGTVVTLDRLEMELTVVGFTQGQATFGHVDVAYLPLDTWRLMAAGQAQPGEPTAAQVDALDFPYASVVALLGGEGAEPAYELIDAEAGTTTMTLTESFKASPGYEAETLTLNMIQVFLYAICALVVGAFFTVWTIQRTHDIAVLRAVGASSGYLLRDSLAQAAILLFGFTALGVAAGVGMGAVMPDAMPFDLEVAPIAVASAVTIALGLIGAAIAVLRITRIDPLRALGGQR
jgi:putative ABC transport system permease protein